MSVCARVCLYNIQKTFVILIVSNIYIEPSNESIFFLHKFFRIIKMIALKLLWIQIKNEILLKLWKLYINLYRYGFNTHFMALKKFQYSKLFL